MATSGDVMTQARLEVEIAKRAEMLNRLKFELQSIKALTDTLGSAGIVALPVGTRVNGQAMVTADADQLVSALGDMVTAVNAWVTTFAARIWGIGF